MQPVKSTAKILAYKMLNRSVDEEWVDWAVEMMMAGFDTESLVILAGINPFYNQFELKHLTDNVFNELNLDYSDKESVFKSSVSYMVEQCLNEEKDYIATLCSLKNLYNELEQDHNLQHFYLLYYAYQDLQYDNQQWYIEGVTKHNIDAIIKNDFKVWLNNNPIVFKYKA